MATEQLTYGSYLRIAELLDLQHPLSDPPHHDELLFIAIHQVYELWFKSAQFREIEFLGGVRGNEDYLRHLDLTGPERERLERRLREPTLYDALKAVLRRNGFDVSSHDALVATFRSIYQDDASHYALYLLLEDLIDFDEKFALWRSRHVLMVERMIGMKPGTGGSLGVGYLQTTLSRRFFPELWEVRTVLGQTVQP